MPGQARRAAARRGHQAPNGDCHGVERGKEDIIDIVKALGKHGYCGVTFPQKNGGLGLPMKHELILSESICSYSLPVDMSRLSGSYPALLARMFGKTRDLKESVPLSVMSTRKLGLPLTSLMRQPKPSLT